MLPKKLQLYSRVFSSKYGEGIQQIECSLSPYDNMEPHNERRETLIFSEAMIKYCYILAEEYCLVRSIKSGYCDSCVHFWH